MGAGGWIGLIVGGLGGVVGLACAVIFGGLPGIIMSVIFVGIFGAVFYPMLIKPMMTASRLRKVGVSATAKVLEANDTGVTLNNSPQVKLLLEVNSPTGTYLVETKQYVSRLQVGMFAPGNMLPVLIDPNDRNMISLDYEGKGGGGMQNQNQSNAGYGAEGPNQIMTGPWTGMSKQQAEQKLVDLDNKSKRVPVTAPKARAIVTKYTWLGMYVNGNNPAVELEIEVLAADRPAFTGKVYGVIHEQSVPKYQAGEDIYVRYDPFDSTNIAIEHS